MGLEVSKPILIVGLILAGSVAGSSIAIDKIEIRNSEFQILIETNSFLALDQKENEVIFN